MYQFIIILDEIKGIRYSQNELNNGNLTAIQLVNYLRISHSSVSAKAAVEPSESSEASSNMIPFRRRRAV